MSHLNHRAVAGRKACVSIKLPSRHVRLLKEFRGVLGSCLARHCRCRRQQDGGDQDLRAGVQTGWHGRHVGIYDVKVCISARTEAQEGKAEKGCCRANGGRLQPRPACGPRDANSASTHRGMRFGKPRRNDQLSARYRLSSPGTASRAAVCTARQW